jgi:DNA-binding CsgD family transcriptional regulator
MNIRTYKTYFYLRRALTYILLLFVSTLITNAQDIPTKGVPALRNFTPSEYNNKGKVWSIDTAPNGIVYFASDKGLLEYDGRTWKSFSGSDGITRSVYVASDSVIYTGSDLDFGIWTKDKYQNFEYTSLYPFKEDLNTLNEEFWDIHSVKGSILFVSSNNIYVYKEENLTKIPAPNHIASSFKVDDEIYFVDEEEGLYKLNNLSPEHIFQLNGKINLEIAGLYNDKNGLVIVTNQNGLYRFASNTLTPIQSSLSENLKVANVFSLEQIDSSYIAFGTILDGLFITDMNGNIVHHINKNKGIQNNTVLSLNYSESGRLWLGMDYGVSFLDLNSAFTFFYDFSGEFGTGYTAVIKENTFYLGSNQGLYKIKWEDLNNRSDFNEFGLVPGTEGQVWTLEALFDQTWMGHDRGLFVLSDGGIKSISNKTGYWDVQPYKEFLLAGTYNGISIFNKNDSDWQFLKQMDLFIGSCNQVIIEGENILWVNIPNYGIIKAVLNEDLYPEERKIFFSEEFKGDEHFLIQNENGIQVQTGSQSYSYDSDEGKFIEDSSAVAKPEIESNLLRNAQSVQLNDNFEFYPVYNGFALKDLRVDNSISKPLYPLLFRSAHAFNNNDNVLVHNGSEIPYTHNNLIIESIVPNQELVLYQFKLDDSSIWSEWSPENEFELVDLSHGSHELNVRAKLNGVIISSKKFIFSVATPWYLTIYALLLYLVALFFLIYAFYKWRQSSLKKLKKDLLIKQQTNLREQAERYNRRLKRVEDENLRLEFDQVKAQLKNKTIELATKAKENEEINKVLQELKEKFEKLEQNPNSLKSRMKEIQNLIESHLSIEDNTFEIQMDELHQQFFENLRNGYPELTNYDLRLCAYIKLGFNSKEIANMLNIMPSSIYISRSRLRKKLNLSSDSDLNSFLNSI